MIPNLTDELEEEINSIPLKNLPFSNLKALPYPKTKDGVILTDNVLVGAVGKLQKVSLVGQEEDGEFYFASSVQDPLEIIEDLENFINLIKSNIQ